MKQLRLFYNSDHLYLNFRLIGKSILPAYAIILQRTSSDATSDSMETSNTSVYRSFVDLPKELFQMLASAGPYLYRDALLLQKVHNLALLYA